ncbi:MAG: response regulator [Candidatus Omnitrophica bacterium]|nr:response regulator [Candidatus Omnitrophota bacterium]
MSEQSVKILVVDDEEGILDFVQRILRFRGFETWGTIDGVEAVRIFEQERPAIVLIDVQLNDSKIDGIEVLERIKKIAPLTVCLMITRITEPDAIDRAKALGAEQYLLKPLDTKELLLQVTDAVRLMATRY